MTTSAYPFDFSGLPETFTYSINPDLPFGFLERWGGINYVSPETGAAISQHRRNKDRVPEKKVREVVLETATSLVVGDRNAQYGEPYDDFKKVSDALNSYGFKGPGGRDMMPRDVPFFQILVKLSRIVQSPTKMDSWVDAAGYAACGAEVAEVEAHNND